jgi:hypothetical protein
MGAGISTSLLIAGMVISFTGMTGTAYAQEDEYLSEIRKIVEPVTGAEIKVSNEGNCDKINVHVNIHSSDQVVVDYVIDENCIISQITGVRNITSDPASPDEGSSISAASSIDMKTSNNLPRGTSCNYIHSSQTVLDVVSLTIARSRLHSNRCWTGSQTRMESDVWAESYTALSWNHSTGITFPWVNRTWAATASARSQHNFHTDWAWCNASGSWQTIKLTNTNISYANGSYGVTFAQDRSCPGTHMSTASKTSTSRTW